MATLRDTNTLSSPHSFVFSSSEGFTLCRTIISERLAYNPHDYQLEGVCKSLDGIDLLAITPTGSGKTGFLVMYMLVMKTIGALPALCPNLPAHFRKNPAMLVVCPTRSLEHDMEPKFKAAGLSTCVVNAETSDQARRKGEDIWKDVAQDVNILLLAPEQLRTKGFEHLVRNNAFQDRIVAIGIDEVHLLDTWGTTFRTSYKQLGFARMRFKNSPVLINLTATLHAGRPTISVGNFVGLHPTHHVIRHSNLRHDIQLIFRTIASAARGTSFPELDWVLENQRRIIVFCPTIALSFRVAHYLWRKSEHLPDRELRIRMYNALNWATYNLETLGFLHSDSRSRVTIATDTLSVGIDTSNTDDVVLYDFEFPANSDVILQKAGRIHNGIGRSSRVMIYLPRNAAQVAQQVHQ